jgi:hypothetical protein
MEYKAEPTGNVKSTFGRQDEDFGRASRNTIEVLKMEA